MQVVTKILLPEEAAGGYPQRRQAEKRNETGVKRPGQGLITQKIDFNFQCINN